MDVLPNVKFSIKLDSSEPVSDHDWSYFKWTATFEKEGRTFVTQYRTGLGLIDKDKPKYAHMNNNMTTVEVNPERDGLKADKIPVANLSELNKKHRGKWDYLLYRPSEPTKNEVLQSLSLDASTFISMPTFEEWCRDFGYDDDSIKAKKIFDTCYEQTAKVKSFLGTDDFNTLLDTDFDNLPEDNVESDSPTV